MRKIGLHIAMALATFGLLYSCSHTRQVNSGTGFPPGNHLASQSSPYLKLHAHDVIDWYPWGEEALARARKQNKLVIISSGFFACHWCDVMHRNCFSDSSVARLMNQHFICIKVDREEHPDVDQMCQRTLLSLTGQGGWPVNVVALPDGRPLHATGYQDKNEWTTVLNDLQHFYITEPDKSEQLAQQIHDAITFTGTHEWTVAEKPGSHSIPYYPAGLSLIEMYDTLHGGLSGTPKFPNVPVLDYLLQCYVTSGDEKFIRTVVQTADHMAAGALHDHLGGGFARYCVDEAWQRPHFEKMLTDNAQLLSLYSNLYRITKNPAYENIARNIIAFTSDQLSNGQGGYYSSMGAGIDGEEGVYYLWDYNEASALLNGDTSALRYFHITREGNFGNGLNVVCTTIDSPGSGSIVLSENVERWKHTLLQKRNQRIAPPIDTKVTTASNALMVKGLADAYKAFGDPDMLKHAVTCLDYLCDQHMTEHQHVLLRSQRSTDAYNRSFLDDYAYFIEACMAIYEVTFDEMWLQYARRYSDEAIQRFKSDDTSLLTFSPFHPQSILPENTELADPTVPAANAVICLNLAKLGAIYNDTTCQSLSKAMYGEGPEPVRWVSPAYASWYKCGLFFDNQQPEIIICGKQAIQFNHNIQEQYLPDAVICGCVSESNLPILNNRRSNSQTTIFVCHNHMCLQPVFEVKDALQLLKNE
jgi:uncharacterized protein